MRRRHTKTRRAPVIAGLAAVCALLKLFSVTGAATHAEDFLAQLVTREGATEKILDLELGAPKNTDFAALLLSALLPPRAADTDEPDAESTPAPPEPTPPVMWSAPPTPPAVPTPEPTPDPGTLVYDGDSDAVAPPEGIDNSAPLPADGIVLDNNSGLEIDAAALLREPLKLDVTPGEPSVLIIHTHSSEAYTKSPGESFEESDPYRTEDKEHSIIKVGDALAAALAARGLTVIHDRGLNDWPSYAGAYARSLVTAQDYLEKYPSISLVIDLHRDAISSADGSQFKTIADIDGDICSQVMLVVGTNGSGLTHPGWRENMKLALRLQYEMNRTYPTLARPITAAQHRYNQHVASGALLVEVGAAGNTLSESVAAARYFAEAYANVVTAR
ncbi:MAG: stage II sporulation protein P [Oscillospiraceae bacterium]|jgi:stage II sporulation protein P|nr:stage II sporulation protein P [Oscillospiraceae bacterium]